MLNVRIALAGNPNSGKTTIFNRLAGAREKIGNWPGTTVEKKEGILTFQGQTLTVVDLPGTYSLNAQSIDERIAADFLTQARPQLVVVVVDASNLERSLYLVVQLLEMGQNLILALNMMDLVKACGLEIDSQEIGALLKVPVVECVATSGKGLDRLRDLLFSQVGEKPQPLRVAYGPLEEEVLKLERYFSERGEDFGYGARALAVRVLEGAPDVLSMLETRGIRGEVSSMIHVRRSPDLRDPENVMIERKYALIKGVLKECTRQHLTFQQRLTLSDQIDKVVTHRFFGIPIFFALMYLMFSLVFQLGEPLVGFLEQTFSLLGQGSSSLIATLGGPAWMASLISDGIISGVGSVLVFLPYIMLLYLGISFMQDSGYLARAAFIMDRFMHRLGLHGKSFIPMLLGFGCSIPGILATRTLASEKDRILTILILPLMSCAARLPVYTLFAAALFPEQAGLVVFSLYLFGIVMAILMAMIFKKIFFRAETTHLVMELPPYRLPRWKEVCWHTWFQALMFIKKAGTVIFVFVVGVWILASLPPGVEYASKESLVGRLGQFIAPLFAPAGFGFWQAAVALIFGVMAKEIVVGIMGTLFGVEGTGLSEVLSQHFTPLSGYAFLVMTALYIPCIASIATIRKETHWRWTGLVVLYTFILGWIFSVLVYQIGKNVLNLS